MNKLRLTRDQLPDLPMKRGRDFEARTERVLVRMTPETRAFLEQLAKREGEGLSTICRRILQGFHLQAIHDAGGDVGRWLNV